MTTTGQLARYYAACNNLLRLFCEKQGFSMTDTYWVAGRIGEVADCAGFCFSMADIITDLEEDAPPGKILPTGGAGLPRQLSFVAPRVPHALQVRAGGDAPKG